MRNILHYYSKQIFFLFVGWQTATWPANNCIQIMVCLSAIMSSNCVWLQIIFCLYTKETKLFPFLLLLLHENGSFPKIFIKKQTWSLNDETILLGSVIAKYCDLSVSGRPIICLSQVIVHFTVTGGNEATVDLVLIIEPFSFIMLI